MHPFRNIPAASIPPHSLFQNTFWNGSKRTENTHPFHNLPAASIPPDSHFKIHFGMVLRTQSTALIITIIIRNQRVFWWSSAIQAHKVEPLTGGHPRTHQWSSVDTKQHLKKNVMLSKLNNYCPWHLRTSSSSSLIMCAVPSLCIMEELEFTVQWITYVTVRFAYPWSWLWVQKSSASLAPAQEQLKRKTKTDNIYNMYTCILQAIQSGIISQYGTFLEYSSQWKKKEW